MTVFTCIFFSVVLTFSACGKDGGQEQAGSVKGVGEETEGIPDAGDRVLDESAGYGQEVNKGEEDGAETEAASFAGRTAVSPSVCGRLSVKGSQLVDQYGNAVQLRGVSTHGLAWFPQYVNEELFRELRNDWGANVIRLAMYTAESGGYCTDGDKESLKELVKKGVKCAADQDLYVIVDWHILSDNNPNQYKEEAISFFAEMSEELADYDHVLYEICNEPNGGTSWGEIKSYADEVIPVIRANAPEAVILVGTPNWSQKVEQAAADPVAGYGNVMYTLHFYAATHTGALRNAMAKAIDAGFPVFVSEYGICDASGNGGIDKVQAKAWVQLMDQYKVSYVAWNLSNKAETSAIIQSAVDKVSGFSEDDLSDSGRWLRRILMRNAGQAAGAPQGNAGTGGADGDSGRGSESADLSGISGGGSESADLSGISGGGSTNDSSSDAPQGNGGSGDGTVVCSGKSGGLEVTAALSSSWESGGRQFYQYVLTVKNSSGQMCRDWSLDVAFNTDIIFSDGWNGKYSAEGDSLHISSEDYNGQLAAGNSTGDVGFIVSGQNGLEIQGIR